MASTPSTAIDPICGMTVSTANSIQAVKDEETYYFCCPKCKERFLHGETRAAPQLVTLSLPANKSAATQLTVLNEQAHGERGCETPVAITPHACCGHAAEHAVVPASDKAYFCPMCPGEESDKPGYCGTCGMALERNPNFYDPAADAADALAESRFRAKVWAAMALATVVFLLAMLPMIGVSFPLWLSSTLSGWVQCGLTTVVMLLAWPYWLSGFGALRQRSANMFTLIGLGAWSAYILSLLYLLVPGIFPHAVAHARHAPLYFESAAVIVALVMLGQWLEGSARKRTGSDLEKLVAMLPKVAHRIINNELEDIEPLALQKGDRIVVKPGESIPADSILEEGSSEVDESLLTGESLPVSKQIGDRLIAGTVNQISVIKARVVVAGGQSVLAQIIQRVGNAQRSRAPIQDLVDRITTYFVPIVVIVALIAAVGWWWFGPEPQLIYAFLAALSVLVIACPCALGLATPMSIIVGVGRAAREGYLVRDAKVFQKLANVDTVVFDKTGTLTEGKPKVISWICHPDIERAQILRWGIALEQTSEHPLAKAIASYGRAELLPDRVDDVIVHGIETLPGKGTSGWIAGKQIAIGRESWLRTFIPEIQFAQQWFQDASRLDVSEAWVAMDMQLVARIQLADEPRESAERTVQQLREMGLELYLLSGDRENAVSALAQRLGLKHYRSEVSPEIKRQEIEALKKLGKRVAMVGDGINDAPALATADVGIAMSGGTDLAQQSSDITLLEGDLKRLVNAIGLSRGVVQNVQQNLTLGLMYNVIAIPIAAGLLYPWTGWTLSPMLAAAAMAASSLSVVGNALRLRL